VLLKKTAAPLCALAAASIVYLVSSRWLAGSAELALSKAAPAVPDLGSLPAAGSEKKRVSGQAPGAPSKAAAPAAPVLHTEITSLPEGLSWPGKGLIEVVTSEDELIYIDGVFTGRGPLRRVPVTPTKHHVAIKSGGEERTGTVDVQADKTTRVVFRSQGPAPSAE
jgi:hypothetical protein